MQWSRQELDAFNPDLVIIFGDDQYENFRKPQEARFVESWLTNANKVFAVFRP
jgi:hypothetical protein